MELIAFLIKITLLIINTSVIRDGEDEGELNKTINSLLVRKNFIQFVTRAFRAKIFLCRFIDISNKFLNRYHSNLWMVSSRRLLT